ncbi:MAG: HD-GYP domain-containing protein [Deltaproteobacteria bacterium]|nr:HD-GYP domain-containing protein [Deltaproteobacteria bacterium]
MPKHKSNGAALAVQSEEPEHEISEHGHDHGAQTTEQAAFLSLVFRTFRENQDLKIAYNTLLNQTIKALLRCLEERDPYTYGHSMRVMEYAMMIGRGAKLKESDMRNLELSAMFHDIGKVGIADCVLLKPGRLDAKEQAIIQEHPVKSGEILGLIDAFKNIVPGARHHHERMDGEGYPDRLSGNQIPLASRIILVGDTFDAMTSSRPYRKALPVEVAYAELERYSGSQFDPEFVKVFLREHQRLTGGQQPEELVITQKKAA